MTPNEYQELASRTDPDRTDQVARLIENLKPGGSWLVHSQIGLAGEVGELAAAIQRWLYYGKELDRTNVIEELGDLCWYLAQACRAMDVKLEDVMKANLQKLKHRYPERYTDFHAAEENRDRATERAVIEEIKACHCVSAGPSFCEVHVDPPLKAGRDPFVSKERREAEASFAELPLPIVHADFRFDAKAVKEELERKSENAYRESCIESMQRQALQTPQDFIVSQTGARPATPICPRCKTVINKSYCPECKMRTV